MPQEKQISHLEQPWESGEASPVLAALDYLRREMHVLGVSETELQGTLQKVSFTEPKQQGVEYRLGGEKTLFDSSTVIFNQTYLNVPVWRAPYRVIFYQNA